jgi:hypothetical protein
VFGIVLVPYVISRVLVIATLGVTREVVRDLATLTDPIQVGQGLHAWDAAFYAAIARGGYDAVATEGLRFFPLFPLLARAAAILPGVDSDLAVVLVEPLRCCSARAYRLAFLGAATSVRPPLWLLYLVPRLRVVMGYAGDLHAAGGHRTLRDPPIAVVGRRRRAARRRARGRRAAARRAHPGGGLRNRRSLTGTESRASPRSSRPSPVASPISWAADRDQLPAPLRIRTTRRAGSRGFPITNVIGVARDFSTGDHDTAGLHLLTIAVCIGLLVVLARRWPASYTLYAASALILALTARNLDSLERYMLSTVPFVFALADVVDTESRERVVLVLAAAGLVAAAALAFTGSLVP